MKHLKTLGVILISLIVLSSCAYGTGIHCESETITDIYGFWGGFWHGIILPFSWVGTLFSDEMVIYAVNNNGGWYDFGFVLALGGVGQIIKLIFKTLTAIAYS